jgi:hypothetical protein
VGWSLEGLVPLTEAGSFACDLSTHERDEESGMAAYLLHTVTNLQAPCAPRLPME